MRIAPLAMLFLIACLAFDPPTDPTDLWTRLARVVENQVRANLPREVEDRRHWGATVAVFDGFKARGQGLRVRLEKRKKEVPHGLWRRSRVWLNNPATDLQLTLRVRDKPNSSATLGATQPLAKKLPAPVRQTRQMEVEVVVLLQIEAEIQQWSNGIKLLGATTRATAKLGVTLAMDWTWEQLGLGLFGQHRIDLTVVDADLKLISFELERIGKLIRGKLAHEIGDSLRDDLAKRLDKEEAKVVDGLNKAIRKAIGQHGIEISAARLLK